MDDKKQAENNVPAVDTTTPPEKDLISSEDVLAVISGDQVALVEQMERAKEAALLQKSNAQEIAAEKAKKKLEEEEKKKKAIMDEVKRRKEEALRREQLAKEEAERKRIAAEEERKRQLEEKKRLEEEAKARAEQERLEAEKKKQEKEAAIKAKEDAKKAKEQARLDAKKQKEQARLDAKKARIEAKEAAIKAKEDAKKARIEAKEAAIKAKEAAIKQKLEARENAKKARLEARENAKKARLEAKKANEQARKDAKSKQSVLATKTVVPSSPQKSSVQPSVPTPVVLPKKEVPYPSEIQKKPSLSAPSRINLQANSSSVPNNDKSKKESNLKYYMTFIFLTLLIWMVAFLPEISSLVSDFFDNRKQEDIPKITTGTLTCTMNTSDDKYDYYYKAIFDFEDGKMYRLTYSATTKGDQHLDAVELSAMKSSCDLLQQQTVNSKGIDVSCSLSNGVYENIQKLDYGTLDVKNVTTAYLEAGGTYPNYKYEQSIDEIEKEMKASNYSCERQR